MDKKYTIGLDLGVSNIGWAIFNNEDEKIEKSGVRIFNQSKGAADRRIARGSRRRRKRQDNRVTEIKKELNLINFPSKITQDSKLIFTRVNGIKERISKQDIVNILCYMVANRGYIPYDENDDDKILVIDLKNQYPCEYYYDLYKELGKYHDLNLTVKNTDNIKEIQQMLSVQSKYYKEINQIFQDNVIKIFSRKRKFWEGPGGGINYVKTPYGRFKNDDDVSYYLNNKKNNLNYEKYLFEDLIGNCSVYLNERRAPKFNYYAEYFNFLNDFINISFRDLEKVSNIEYIFNDGKNNKLNIKGLEAIKKNILDSKSVSLKNVYNKILGTEIDNISGMKQGKNGKFEMSLFENYRYIKSIFEKANLDISWMNDIDLYNKVVYHLTVSPGVVEIKNMINSDKDIHYKFSSDQINKFGEIKNKKTAELNYHSLSEKILKRSISDMLKYQMNFMQVSKKEDYEKEAREYFQKNYTIKDGCIPQIEEKYVDEIVASPQVKKTLRQAIKIINAIMKKEKRIPYVIAVESTKELNGKEKKKKIEYAQKHQEELRKAAVNLLESLEIKEINNKKIEKIMLYKEINGHCIYCDKPIDINDVINGIIEVEHILPKSKSFDNSFDNKTLSCRVCNKNKSNNTPYDYLKGKNMYEEFEKRIIGLKLGDDKESNLLFKDNLDKYSKKFINRNLRDTAYATTELINQINLFNHYLEYNYEDLKIKTLSTPGQLTHSIRENYKLEKNRDSGLSHHAIDASIVASISNTEIGELILESQNNPKFWIKNKDNIDKKANLLDNIDIKFVLSYLKTITDENVVVSSQVIKNPQGKLANSNIYKIIEKDNQYFKIDQINNIYEVNFEKANEINIIEKLFDENDKTSILLCYDKDKKLFNKLRGIYLKYKNDKGNPFVNYVKDINNNDKINVDGVHYGIRASEKSNAPFVLRLRYYTKINLPYLLETNKILKGVKCKIALDSLSQVCTRVYIDKDKNKFAFLPIFAVSVDLKTKKIDDNNIYYKQMFSYYIGEANVEHIVDLYNGDFIQVIKTNGEKALDYYQYFHKTNNKIVLKNGSYFTKSDRGLIVYDVNVLGNKKERLTKILY